VPTASPGAARRRRLRQLLRRGRHHHAVGGFKQSGTGRDKSLHAFDKYTELKTTWIDLS